MDNTDKGQTRLSREATRTLLLSIFAVAACGIFYELLIGTISSYFVGSSVLLFSLTIGLFLFFMGIGSYFSKYIIDNLLKKFIAIEIVIGLVGGLSGLILYYGFSATRFGMVIFGATIAVISMMIGMELPLVIRIIERYSPMREAVAHVMAYDYVGALVASIVFPLVMLPYLGLMRTSFTIGCINILVAAITAYVFRKELHSIKFFGASIAVAGVLIVGFVHSFSLVHFFESLSYQDQIIFTDQTQYQRIVMTRFKDDVRLYLNGNLQFSSIDEYRYHESLAHVPMSLTRTRERVAILGGGDGLLAREVLKYQDVKQIDLIDIDSQMTNLSRTNPLITKLNNGALDDPRVHVINKDAFTYLKNHNELYDVILIDLPDPNDHAVGKLYTVQFYEIVKRRLAENGIVVTQATSPYFTHNAYWIINHTMKSAFPYVTGYHINVPSFGPWGFHMARKQPIDISRTDLNVETQFLTKEIFPTLFVFDSDISEVETGVHTLDSDLLVREYERSARDLER